MKIWQLVCLYRLLNEADNLHKEDTSCQVHPHITGVYIDSGQFSKENINLKSASYDGDVITEDHC